MKREWRVLIILAICVSALTMVISLSSGGSTLNNYFSDFLYDRTSPEQGECIVIGIDEYALDQLGSWPWSRDIMADVIDILNMDPDAQPAAIGVDVIFSGESDEYADDRLAESIADSDNVILACSASFAAQLVEDSSGILYMDDFQITEMTYPYELFQTTIGHVNAMYDTDGILRHHLWSVEYEGETTYSFPYEAYKLWCDANGVEADFEPDTDSRGFWYVEYSREPGDYYAYSVMDIIEGNYDPDLLKDAVVLIGTYEASSMDYFITSADRSERMYGIEYLANVTDAMIRGLSKQHVTNGLMVFVAIFIFGYTLLLFKRPIRQGIIIYIGINMVTLLAYLGIYELGIILEPLWLLVGYAIGGIASLVYHYLTENRKRKYITSVFSRYVDKDIIKQLLKEDSESLGLEGKECNIAIMFIDIRGFTTMSEKLTPMEVVKMLNKYLTLTSSCIKRHEGVVDKFIGDATMAFWGAPLPCDDSVYKACQAALDMAERAQKMDTGGAAFGIGIHYGPAVVGNIGAEDRMDFTAIGDAVNTTQRIESKAPKHTVYVSELVVEMLGERIIATPLEEKLSLKGKAEPMQLYVLEGLK
ncbi:MAG: adenylate/guanylate cyclase domain-containing protein [Eubacteriales bacterium]